jgi:hypothetical protein
LNSEAPSETGGSQPTKRSDRAAMGLELSFHDGITHAYLHLQAL